MLLCKSKYMRTFQHKRNDDKQGYREVALLPLHYYSYYAWQLEQYTVKRF